MKTRTLATLLLLTVCFALAPGSLRAEENEWYQGQQGQWHQQGKSWKWESSHGDDWFQGHQGHWYQEADGWQWCSNDGDVYRKGPKGWKWYHGKHRH